MQINECNAIIRKKNEDLEGNYDDDGESDREGGIKETAIEKDKD